MCIRSGRKISLGTSIDGGFEPGGVGLASHPALLAQAAGEPLGQDGVDGRCHQVGLDIHLDETADARRRVVGVERRQHEVAGERSFDGDLGRLPVANLTDEGNVGVGAENRAEGRGERETGLAVDLHLGDARPGDTRPDPRS